jgi:pantetheine-phosphate adenylyltransferase
VKTIIFPGSFDPFSLGHADIAKRAAKLCDRLLVAVMLNRNKNPLFSIEERVEMVKLCLSDIPNVEVISYNHLLVDLFRESSACAVVRGLRSESDFRNEAEMSAANRLLLPDFDSILLLCRIDLVYTSSSIIKEVASYGGDISAMVSPEIVDFVKTRIMERTQSRLMEEP